MKTNHLTINVNMGEACDENQEVIVNQPGGYPTVANSEDTINKLVQGKESPDQIEEILSKAGLGSIRVNPFLARNVEFPEEIAAVIGDGCIHLPSIFGGKRGHTDPNRLRPGQSTTLGVVVSNRGVIATELTRTSGKTDELREGDSMDLVLRSAEGRKLMAWDLTVEDQDPDGGVIMAAKKCKCPVKVKIKFTLFPPSLEISVETN